ncbi:MAG TPA: hypothetical protein EYG83_09985 [Sulfurospirillum arcachonense]|nr:hypothetical protein [Sulfurospirillum arcachonense]
MLIIGHPLIPFKPLYKVTKIEDIKKTKPNCTILIDFDDKELVQYSKAQDISLALHVKSIKDACLANALGAKFVVVDDDLLAKQVQNLATEYLFDTKILLQIADENAIEKAAKNFIDGVVFKKGIL